MGDDDEVQVDQEVKDALDHQLLSLDGVTTREIFGSVGYLVSDKPFAVLMEGVIGMGLSDAHSGRALTLAGVSPFRLPYDDVRLDGWVQFVLVLAEDTAAVIPWLEAAISYATSEPVSSEANDGA